MPSTRRSLVEDALAQLKRKTDERRKARDTGSNPAVAPEAVAKPKPNPKPKPKPKPKRSRRRKPSKAEIADPRIAELYQAALTDIDGPPPSDRGRG